MSWRFLKGVAKYFMGALETFDRCPLDMLSVSWRYLMGVLDVFDGCLRDI